MFFLDSDTRPYSIYFIKDWELNPFYQGLLVSKHTIYLGRKGVGLRYMIDLKITLNIGNRIYMLKTSFVHKLRPISAKL